MNRIEFIAELERLLEDMPEEERRAAVQYYADYFADAGEEKEEDVLRELGSPRKVAESIKADYYGTEFNEAEFDQKNYMEKYGRTSGQGESRTASGGSGAGEAGNGKEDGRTEQKPWTSGKVKLLLIVLIVIAVWPVSLGAAGVVLGIAATVVCFFAGLVIAAVCIMLAGVIVVGVGLALLVMPPAAMIVTGIGILLFAAGLAATVGTVKLCILVYPAMIRGFVNLCRRPFYGKAV